MSKVKVKFKRQSRWNVGGKITSFGIGDVFEADPAMAKQMVTHNYADYVDKKLAKKDMVEENKAVEAAEESKDEVEDEDDSKEDVSEAKSKKKSGRSKKSK